MRTLRASKATLFVIVCILLHAAFGFALTDGEAFQDLVKDKTSHIIDRTSYLNAIEAKDPALARFYTHLRLLIKSVPVEVGAEKSEAVYEELLDSVFKKPETVEEKSFERDYSKTLNKNEAQLIVQGLIDFAAISYFVEQDCEQYEKSISLLWHFGKNYQDKSKTNLGFLMNENSVILTSFLAYARMFPNELKTTFARSIPFSQCLKKKASPNFMHQIYSLNMLLAKLPSGGMISGAGGQDDEGNRSYNTLFARHAWDEKTGEMIKSGMVVAVGWVETKKWNETERRLVTYASSASDRYSDNRENELSASLQRLRKISELK